jgi:WhiB family redox-sensing transcriptional regulator
MTLHIADAVEEIDELGVVEALMRSTGPMPSLRELLGRPAWQARAACRGEHLEQFFPPEGTGGMRARRICNGCTVAEECLQYALERPSLKGIWAGTSERCRRRLRAEALTSSGQDSRPAEKNVV